MWVLCWAEAQALEDGEALALDGYCGALGGLFSFEHVRLAWAQRAGAFVELLVISKAALE